MKTEQIKTRINKWRNSLLVLFAVIPLLSLKGGSMSELEQLETETEILKREIYVLDVQLKVLESIEKYKDSVDNLIQSNEIHSDTVIVVIK